MRSIKKILRLAGGLIGEKLPFRAELGPDCCVRICEVGRSPTGLLALSVGPGAEGPVLHLERGDLAWYPYEYREPDQLFACCVYRTDQRGRLHIDYSLRQQLSNLAGSWDRELLEILKSPHTISFRRNHERGNLHKGA